MTDSRSNSKMAFQSNFDEDKDENDEIMVEELEMNNEDEDESYQANIRFSSGRTSSYNSKIGQFKFNWKHFI